MASASSSLAVLRDRVFGQIDLAPCDGCDACGLRCTAGVQMSRDEYAAVQAYVRNPAHAAYVAEVAAQPKPMSLGDGVEVTACRFRDRTNGRCAVYAVRPLVCKLLGHVEWLPCPIGAIGPYADTQDGLRLLRGYAAHERHTFEKWEALDGTDGR